VTHGAHGRPPQDRNVATRRYSVLSRCEPGAPHWHPARGQFWAVVELQVREARRVGY